MYFTDLDHLSIPFEQIKEATTNFTTIIGKGGYGPVYKGQISLSGETELTTVAIKRLDTKISGQGLKEFLTEIQLLSRYNKHPNLISLVGFCDQGPEKVLIYEYAHLGSLDKYLRSARNPTCTLTWMQRLNICIDAARGLDHLHNHIAKHERIIHRDIKSANVLLDSNWRAMIADFGLSKIGRANENESFLITNPCGTHGYCDPLYQQTGILTKESDVYSFGVVLFEVLCGRLCFFMDAESKQRLLPQMAKIYYKKNKLNRIIDPTLKEYMDSNSMKKFSRIAYQCLLDDREGRPPMDLVLQELEKALHLLSFSSGEVDKNCDIRSSEPESWDQDGPASNQTKLIVGSDLVATGELNSTGVVKDSCGEHLGSTFDILRKKKSDYNNFLVESFSHKKKSLVNNGDQFGGSYITHWVAIWELSKEVTGWGEDASGRLVYEFVSCVTIVISRVVQHLKACMSTKDTEVAINDLKEILDHAKESGIIVTLLSCLDTCGKSLMSGSSNFLCAACKACEAIWLLIDAFEIQSTIANSPVFPLSSVNSHLLDRINIKGDESEPFIGKDYEEIVETVTQAFLGSEATRVAIFNCLHQRVKASWCSVIQIILRCCVHNDSVGRDLCGLSNSLVVGGGGDNTIISEVFSIISLCASFDTEPEQEDTNNLKSKVSDPSDLVLHACLLIALVAHSIDESPEENTAVTMLTSSRETQQSRLSDLAYHYSLCDGIQNFRPHSMSAMLALAYMCSLEDNESVATSIREIVVPLIPPSATLCNYLRMSITDSQGVKTMLSYWHGFRDGCVILLFFRLLWGGPLAIQELGSCDIPQSLLDLLGNKQHANEIGLSPLGIMWTVSSLRMCLKGGTSVFRQVLLTSENVKIMCELISDVQLKLLRYWVGPGGGKIEVKGAVNQIIYLLRFPFEASEESSELQDMDSSDMKDMVLEIKACMDKYIQILLETGLPGKIIKALEHLELKDTEEPLYLLTKMAYHRLLAVELVGKGLLNSNFMKRLLHDSSPTQVKLDVLVIVSKLAEMDKEFYKQIDEADILHHMKAFLTYEDPIVRGWTCNAIGDMCRHSSYFYSLLKIHNIVSLLIERLFDTENFAQGAASFAILMLVEHSDLFYEDLIICIPQIAKLLLSSETDNVRRNAVICLGNLSVHSDKLSQYMISKGATEALLKVVEDYSVVVAVEPSKTDANSELLLIDALSTLARMMAHRSLVVELVGKGLLNPNLMKRLLHDSSPTQVKLRVLRIISKVAATGKEFYKPIDEAHILQKFKVFLTHEDPNVRGWTCQAIEDMCIHSSYSYKLLEKHNIINLLIGRLSDKDNYPQCTAMLAIMRRAQHSDMFYEDLRIYIPQLAKLLLSPHTPITAKQTIATCLGYLSAHSDILCRHMISKGAMEALFKVVEDYSDVALYPSMIEDMKISLVRETLIALAKMYQQYSPCKKFIRSSRVYSVIRDLRNSLDEDIASYATLISKRKLHVFS